MQTEQVIKIQTLQVAMDSVTLSKLKMKRGKQTWYEFFRKFANEQ